MDWFSKKPLNVEEHLKEYTEYQKNLPRHIAPGEYDEFLFGFLSTIGFHLRHRAVWDPEQRVYFFPFLDEYWTRAGVVFLDEEDLQRTQLMSFRLKIASCLREAKRRGELYRLIDMSRGSDLRNWLVLGGSE